MIDKVENVDKKLENIISFLKEKEYNQYIIDLLKEAKSHICSEARMKELLGINLY